MGGSRLLERRLWTSMSLSKEDCGKAHHEFIRLCSQAKRTRFKRLKAQHEFTRLCLQAKKIRFKRLCTKAMRVELQMRLVRHAATAGDSAWKWLMRKDIWDDLESKGNAVGASVYHRIRTLSAQSL